MCLPSDRNDLRLQHTALVTTAEFKALPIDKRYDLIMSSFSKACLLTSATKPAHATNDFALQALTFNYNGKETIHEFRERYTATHIECYGNTPLPREHFMTRIGDPLRELYDTHMATQMATHENMTQPNTLEKICDIMQSFVTSRRGEAIMLNNTLAAPKPSATSSTQPLQGPAAVPSTAIPQTMILPQPAAPSRQRVCVIHWTNSHSTEDCALVARYPNMSLLDIITEVSNRKPMFLADNAPKHPALNDKGDRQEPYYQDRRPPRREHVRHREPERDNAFCNLCKKEVH